ncbi:methylmalonyl-CoA carboxyltransferase, partial [Streptomyces sp. SID2563]
NEIAVMGAEGAANVVFRRQIAASDDPEATRQQLVKEYKAELMHPYYAAERGLVDDVIDPAHTRAVLAAGLAMLRTKTVALPHRKHGNQPA